MVALTRWFGDFLSDLRYGLRQLRGTPFASAACILTLALGIGANAAIFSVVDSVLLRSLPFKNTDRLVDLTEYKAGGVDSGGVPFPDYLVWRDQNTVFDESAAYFSINASNDVVLGGPFSTERERYSTVTNGFFSILGVQPALWLDVHKKSVTACVLWASGRRRQRREFGTFTKSIVLHRPVEPTRLIGR